MQNSDIEAGQDNEVQKPFIKKALTKHRSDQDLDDHESDDNVDSPEKILKIPNKTIHVSQRFRAPGLLVFGATSSLFGFIFVTFIGYIDFHCRLKNEAYDNVYKSGVGYFPSTVSEMVHNSESPAGKVFYTFGLISGVSIFLSMYPTHLRNVYTFDEKVAFTSMYWTTFRQIVPAMGIWLLVGIHTYPTQEALTSTGKTKMFCVLLHLLGAGMLFIGYMCSELHVLGIWPFTRKADDRKWPSIEKTEMRIRVAIAITMTIGCVGFCITQVILFMAKKNMCCADEWILPGQRFPGTNETVRDKPQIFNTASGEFLWLKMVSFAFEDIAGMSLVFSHMAIWFFCEERLVDYGKSALWCVHYQPPDS